MLALAVVLLAVGVLAFARRLGAEQPQLGVQWGQTERGAIVLEVEPESAGAHAGLRPGDLLLRVNGESVASALDAAQIGWSREKPDGYELTIERAASTLTIDIYPAWVPFSDIYAYLSLVGLAFWLSGVFIAIRWPTIRGGVLYPLLALDLFALLVLSHTGRADLFDRSIYLLDLVAAALAPALLVHLSARLARRIGANKRFWVWGAYAASLVMLLADASGHGVGPALDEAGPFDAVHGLADGAHRPQHVFGDLGHRQFVRRWFLAQRCEDDEVAEADVEVAHGLVLEQLEVDHDALETGEQRTGVAVIEQVARDGE